ncbi:MAG: AAA family ATPase [Legionellales bacterium RIFCSPHIGHO2_12_FULL_37_14]|nr:MAG: AAA family ATPase [Legionellales bacterium RIFCSPHIGHO2_12_FULL_37_14]
MQRLIFNHLLTWLSSPLRKPLILRGARQVGKTWLVRELANKAQRKIIEINLENRFDLIELFNSNDPKAIILNLESFFHQKIILEESILFLDEIQRAPQLIAKLRWFYELMPELPVIATGSLLEFELESHSFSMPVGRINYYFVEPMGFEEFLLAKNPHLLVTIKNSSLENPLNQVLHAEANQLFKEFVMVGGMPEAVASWIEQQSLEDLAQIHHNLISTYKDDFAKYAKKLSLQYLQDVILAIPKMLGKKFVYSHVNSLAKHAAIKQALQLLIKARLCHPVYNSPANGIPLGAQTDTKLFKMILLDIGLVSTMLGIQHHQFNTIDDIFLINSGAIAEQAVGQLLRLYTPYYAEPKLYYWERKAQSSSAEIDYLVQYQQQLIPIEVKSGSTGKLRSLHQFMYEKPWKIAVRIYSGPLGYARVQVKTTSGNFVEYKLLSLPYYMLSELEKLLTLLTK